MSDRLMRSIKKKMRRYYECYLPGDAMRLPHCIIVGNTVTALCTAVPNAVPDHCDLRSNMGIETISSKHLSILGTLTTQISSWRVGREKLWQNVVNRAVRMLASGPFKQHFFSVFATVS
ncbi:hypothetical protein KIN20_027040 [Parelaphostrongylus tenuis]|uniref:Uncharacterized protein n=1 Tax=Parelaphostrongylus tenuis TaxID=148309 RepID=A0AAD5QZ16_PARTN|nr:hypothetical protein KIN20_027040 [Parelaphostrongylus tenuis]